jgi:hypothetical protein
MKYLVLAFMFMCSSYAFYKTGTARYCVVTDNGKSCFYYTVNECVNVATKVNGICVVNDD